MSLYLALLSLSLWSRASCASSSKPNVLFVVIDDLGWHDVEFRSGTIKTPTVGECDFVAPSWYPFAQF